MTMNRKPKQMNLKVFLVALILGMLLTTGLNFVIIAYYGGFQGTQGPQGLQGPTGPEGNKGDNGSRGGSGDKGSKGDTGDAGKDGEDAEDAIQPAIFTIYASGSNITADASEGSGKADITGTNFAIVTQAALDSLTADRNNPEKIVIQGDFEIDARIEVDSYTEIELQGTLTFTDDIIAFHINRKENISIYGGMLQGNQKPQTMIKVIGSSHISISEMSFYDSKLAGAGSPILVTFGSSVLWITDCYFENPQENAIELQGLNGENNFTIISGNIIKTTSAHGITLEYNATDNIICDNIISGNGTTNKNGIQVLQAGNGNNSIHNNQIINTYKGIVDIGEHDRITSNYISVINRAIESRGGYELISDNDIAVSGNPDCAILVQTEAHNIITNNQITGDVSGKHIWTIADPNVNHGNMINGLPCENSGYVTLEAGKSSISVEHGLAGAPTCVLATSKGADLGDVWITGVNSTHFIINCDTAPGGNQEFSWYAEYHT